MEIGGKWGKAVCGEDETTTGDPLSVNHEEQHERAEWVEDDRTEANIRDLGCHGLGLAMRHLDYVDYDNLFVVPKCHAVLYGIVKSFWKCFEHHRLQVMSHKSFLPVVFSSDDILHAMHHASLAEPHD